MEAVKQHPGGRHVIATGLKFSLPLTYRGWFEVLSEDGRPCRPLASIAELAQLWPRECVVRENIRALVSGPVNNAQSSTATTTRLERSRKVLAGEKLTLHDEVDIELRDLITLDCNIVNLPHCTSMLLIGIEGLYLNLTLYLS